MEKNEDLTKRARELFAKDYFATETAGIVIDVVKENYAKCTMKIEKKHLNANGSVMGGAIFTLADFTAAVASNGAATSTVTLNSQIQYLRAGKGAFLTAETRCIKSGQKTCVFEVTITDEKEAVVALATSTGIRL